jgi:DHA1 family bicyclomycin/chloramphenicol resistance-like MFS transporter
VLSRLVLVMGVAPILAPLAGGALLRTFGWRAIFAVLAAIGALTLVAVVTTLPETAPASVRQARLRLPAREVLRARGFASHALTVAFAQAAMFAYISGSSFVFISLHGIPASAFGWFFGLNATGLIASSQVNRRLLASVEPVRILGHALRSAVAAGGLLIAAAATGVGGIWSIAATLFLFVSSLGFIVPNATALALEHQVGRVGAASALLGTLLYSISATASWAISAAHDATALPMAIIVAASGALAWVSHLASRTGGLG